MHNVYLRLNKLWTIISLIAVAWGTCKVHVHITCYMRHTYTKYTDYKLEQGLPNQPTAAVEATAAGERERETMVAMYHYKRHKCNKLGRGWRRNVKIKKGRGSLLLQRERGRERKN